MDSTEKSLNLFTTRMRQMILRYGEMRQECARAEARAESLQARIGELEAELAQARADYANLKLARMIEISDGDAEGARQRCAKLIREVDKCITLLGDK